MSDDASPVPMESGPCPLLLGEILDPGCSDDLRGSAHFELAELLLRDPRKSGGALRLHLRTIRPHVEARRQRVCFSPRVEDVFERLAALLDGPAPVPVTAALTSEAGTPADQR